MKTPFADWQGMFGALLPAHIAKQHGGTSGAAGLAASFTWFDKTVPTCSGGPMLISKYVKDTSITEVPNPKWYGKTKSSLDSVIFQIITDQTAGSPGAAEPRGQRDLPAAQLRHGDRPPTPCRVCRPRPVPVWCGSTSTSTRRTSSWPTRMLRTAIFTAISRQSIIDRTVGQFDPEIKPLGNHMYLPGQAGYKDNVTSTGQGSGNVDKAKQMLTSAGYTGVGSTLKTKSGDAVTLSCLYSAGNTVRQAECQILQQTLGSSASRSASRRRPTCTSCPRVTSTSSSSPGRARRTWSPARSRSGSSRVAPTSARTTTRRSRA